MVWLYDISTLVGHLMPDPIYHHHHVTLSIRIFLTLSRHTSLSSIAFGRSSGLHPVSTQGCCMYVRARCPAFAQEYIIYELVPTSPAVSCMSGSSNSFRDWWPYSCCFVGCCLQDLLLLCLQHSCLIAIKLFLYPFS